MADELLFPVRSRGDNARAFLDDLRWGLRQMRDPRTGLAFSEDQIAIATAVHSEFAIKADGIDAVTFLNQQRALWMAAQNRPDRAAGVTLRDEWAVLWELPYLEAAGGSGLVQAPCAPNTTFKGSTTLGDPVAVQGRDPAGKRYQVLFTQTSGPSASFVYLDLVAIDTGPDTNLDVGTAISWIDPPITAPAVGTMVVNAKFTGGIEAETDAQYVPRLIFLIRHKPGAGNRAQCVDWVFKAAQNAIDRAWVYGGAWHAGSALIAVAQKRGSTVGPLARIPTVATMAIVSSYLESVIPVSPGPPAVVALPVVPVTTDLVLSLSMAKDSSAGWADPEPWPLQNAGSPAVISGLINQGLFHIVCAEAPATDTPQLMVWNAAASAFIELSVSSVLLSGVNTYAVTLSGPPTGYTLADGDVISPFTEQAPLVAATLTAYMDSLGAGEVIDVSSGSTDDRRGYAFRWPKPNEQDPSTAGTAVISYLQDALGGALSTSQVESVSVSTPPLPADPIDGPGLLVLGTVGIYAI